MSNLTTDNFFAALTELKAPEPITFEYRVFYDAITKVCTTKTVEDEPGNYVVVSKEEYDEIYFCPNFYVSKGKVVKKAIDFVGQKLLHCSDTGFQTIKNNNIFAVPPGYTGASDFWDIAND